MKSRTTEGFRRGFARLPESVREQAKRAYSIWKKSPRHPSLQFKRIHANAPIYSIRIGMHWRALAALNDDRAVWFWIGPHAEYDKLVARL